MALNLWQPDLAMEIRYILRMLGVKIDGSALMLGDNKSVVINTTIPSSVLKKKHCAIAYHQTRKLWLQEQLDSVT